MQEWLSSRWQHHLVTAAAQQVLAQPNMHPKAASGATLQPIAAASPDGTPSHEALLLLEATSAPCPDQIALPAPAVASAAAYESSAAGATTPSTESPGRKGRTGTIATAAASSCNMAGSQLPDHLPDSSRQNPQGFVTIQSDEDEMDAQAQQQQQQQDATVSTSTKQSAVPGLADAPSTQDGGEVQQAALPSAHGSGNTSASLYPFPSQRSPQDRLEGILRSGPCGEDREGLYVFGRRRATLAEHTAAALAGHAEGQGEGQAEGPADGQTDGQSNGQAGGQLHGQSAGQLHGQCAGQAEWQAEGPSDRQPAGQSAGQAERQVAWQANGKLEGQADGQAEGRPTEGHAQGLAEGQANPSHRQEGQSGQQAVQHAVPPNFLVPCSTSPLADKETQPHPQEGVLQTPLCSKASVPASVIAEAPAAAAQGTTMPAAASKAAAAAAASGAMSMKRMTEAVAGAAQDRLQLKMQHEELVAVALGDKPSNAAAQPAAEAPSAAGPVAAVLPEPASSTAEAATLDVSMLAQSAAGAATPDVSMPTQSAAGAATPGVSEPAQSADEKAAAEVAIPAPVPCTKAAAESLPVSPKVAAPAAGINGKQSKKRKSKYFSETFDQKKRRINRVQKMKAENRAARAADAALPWTASSEGRFADSPSISEENRTPVSASLSASISNGPGILAFFKLFFCCNGWLGTLVYLFYPLFSFLSSIPLASP